MALPSNLYVAWQGVQTVFRDKDTGEPLSAGYVKFFSDVARSVPKDVYEQVQLPDATYQFVNIGSIVTLTSVGTFGAPSTATDIQVYAKPYNDVTGEIELYYMEIYSVDNILQFTREAQPANVQNSQTIDTFEGSDNQIENPQFVETLLPPDTSKVFTVTGTGTMTLIAPDWYIVTNGSGTVTVTALNLTQIVPSGAPFAIELNSGGSISSLMLRQRITNSPRILGSGFISGSFVAKTFGTSDVQLIMRYTAGTNGYTVDLVNGVAPGSGAWTSLFNSSSTAIETTNTTGGLAGYVDIDIIIPVLTDIGITSVQIATVENANSSTEFLQESVPRQLDHLFHYYEPQLKYKPIPSYLVGWDFNLNPFQFGTTTGPIAGANTSWTPCDQTIIFQTVTNSIQATRDVNFVGLKLTMQADSSFSIIQYIPGNITRELLHTLLATSIATQYSGTSLPVQVDFAWTQNANVPIIPNSVVTAIAGTQPTLAAGWNFVSRSGLGNANFTATSTSLGTPTRFNMWDPTTTAGINSATFMAIIITYGTAATGSTVALQYASLNAGFIGTRPAAQTEDEVLRQCQFYYEKSYAQGTTPGTPATIIGQKTFVPDIFQTLGGGGSAALQLRSFYLEYQTIKRINPNLYFYSPVTGTVGFIEAGIRNNGNFAAASAGTNPNDYAIATWTEINKSTSRVSMVSSDTTTAVMQISPIGALAYEGVYFYHYVADSRLGVV